MTTDTLEAEDEMTEARRFPTVEEMVICHHPEWLYLNNATLPVRPANEAEAADYAGRHDAAEWQEIYNPAEPRIVLPPPSAPEITALLTVVPDGEPEPVNGVVHPDHPDLAKIQDDATRNLERWGARTGPLGVVRDDEVHHEPTQVIPVVAE